jgi:hypothetical protein
MLIQVHASEERKEEEEKRLTRMCVCQKGVGDQSSPLFESWWVGGRAKAEMTRVRSLAAALVQ